MRTVGISPKLIAAVVTATLVYVLGQTVLELPPGVVVAANIVLVGVGVWKAPPGDVVPAGTVAREDGQVDPLSALVIALVALLVAAVALRLL